jgi:hypothetical protein
LDAFGYAEIKVNALETGITPPQEILKNLAHVIFSPSFARML